MRVQGYVVPDPFFLLVGKARSRVQGNRRWWKLAEDLVPEVGLVRRSAVLEFVRRTGVHSFPKVTVANRLGESHQTLRIVDQFFDLPLLTLVRRKVFWVKCPVYFCSGLAE